MCVCSVFTFFQNLVKFEEIGCMYAETFGCKVCAFWVHVDGAVGCGCMYMETPRCKYADFGCISMERLGACMRLLGPCIRKGGSGHKHVDQMDETC